jgi:hypothetical protein
MFADGTPKKKEKKFCILETLQQIFEKIKNFVLRSSSCSSRLEKKKDEEEPSIKVSCCLLKFLSAC